MVLSACFSWRMRMRQLLIKKYSKRFKRGKKRVGIKKNNSELTRYYVNDNNLAIISREIFH